MTRRSRRAARVALATITALWALVVSTGRGRASVPEQLGMGPRAGALAGMGAADTVGWEAAYHNPAGLVGARRRLTVGYVLARDAVRLDGAPRSVEPTNGILVGAALPLPLGGPLTDRLALGFAFHFPIGVVTRARTPAPAEARLALLEDRSQTVSILLGLGARLHRRVSVGVGVLALAALTGEVRLEAQAGGRIETIADEQLLASYAPVAGVRVRPSRRLLLGLGFRGESSARYDITVRSRLGSISPVALPTLRIAGVAQYDPLALSLEGAVELPAGLKALLGVTWKRWSAYPPPVMAVTPGSPAPASPGFHDTAVPRLGLELARGLGPVALAARLGYFFEWSPAPAGAEVVLVDADRHVLTGGLGVEWRGRAVGLALDLFAQWHRLAGAARASGDRGVFGLSLGVDL